jgi:fibronectin-binding autotransporter adhesin
MFFSPWLKKQKSNVSRNNRRKNAPAFRLALEPLEDRLAPALLYWDPNGILAGVGGAGTWNTTNLQWTTDPAGLVGHVAWNNGAGDTARFAGTGAAVSIAPAGPTIDAAGLQFDVGSYVLTAAATKSLTATGTSLTIDVVTAGQVATVTSATAAITGVGDSVSKIGAGTLVLGGANTHTGGTTLSAGELRIANNAAAGTGTLTLTAGGIRSDGATARTLTNALSIAGSVTYAANGTGALTFSGAGNLTGTHTFTTDVSDTTFGGILTDGASTFGITKAGSGRLILSNGNTYDGAVSVTAGTLVANNAGALGSTVAGTTVSSGAALDLRVNIGTEALTISGTGVAGSGALFSAATGGTVGGTVTLAASSSIGGAAALTITGVISDGGSGFGITKVNTGTTTLSGANTYGGTTTISAGTLQVGAAGTTGTLGTGAVTNNGALVFNRTNAYTVPNVISGSGTLTQAGAVAASILSLTGANTYSGTTTVSGAGGTLRLVDGGTIATTSAITVTGATLRIDNSGTTNLSDRVNNAAPITLGAGASVIQLIGNNTAAAATTESIGAVTLAVGSNATIRSTVGTGVGASNVLTIASITRAAGGNQAQVTFDGALTGGGTTQALTTAGTNQIVVTGGLPLVNGIVPFSVVTVGGTVAGGGTAPTAGGFATLSGSNVVSATTSVNSINTSTAATNNLITTAAGGTLTAARSANSVFLDGTVAATLLSGAFTLSTKSLGAGISAVAYTTGATTPIDIGSGADATFFANSGSTLTVLGNVVSSGSGITKEGLGANILSGAASNYTGVTTINAGVVTATTSNALGTSAGGTVVGSGTTLNISGNSTIADAITLGTAGGVAAALTFPSGDNNVTGAINLLASSTITSSTLITTQILSGGISLGALTVTIAGAGNTTISTGAITGTGGVTQSATGTVTFNAASTYSGTTTVNGLGTMAFGSSSGAGFGPIGTGTLNITGAATLRASGATQTVANNVTLANNITILVAPTVSLTLAGPITLTGTRNVNIANNGLASFNGVISGAFGLTKSGAATLALGGNNTYTGVTTVSAGTLLVSGSITNGAAPIDVPVAGGATLGGTGTVNGVVSFVSGSNLAPGASTAGTGILNLANGLTLVSGSNYTVELNGTTAGSGYDQTNVTGAVNLGASNLVASSTFNPNGLQTFTIINNDGADAVVGTFAGLANGAPVTIGGNAYNIYYNDGDFDGTQGEAGDGNDVVLRRVPSQISINDVILPEGTGGTTPFTFTVSLDNPSAVTVTVDYATADGTAKDGVGETEHDYDAQSGTLTFTTGSSVAIVVIADSTFEPNENFFVNLSNATNATIADGQGEGTITNDDPQPTVSIGDVTVAEGDGGTTSANFTVSLSNPSDEDITVSFMTQDGSATTADNDYVGQTSSVTIIAGFTTATISITVNGDNKAGESPSENFTVKLTSATGVTSSNPHTITDDTGAGTITDDDAAPVANNDMDTTDEETAKNVDVLGNDTDADDGQAALSVASVDTTGTIGSVTNNGNDVTYDPNGQFNYLAVGQTTPDTFTYIATDGTNQSGSATVTVTITGVNDGPTANNDAGATTELGTTGGNVLTNDTDPDTGETATLVVDAPGTYTGTYGTLTLNGDGSYSYTANANQLTAGQIVTDSFSYQAKDAQNATSNTATLTITITGENDAPEANPDAYTVAQGGTLTTTDTTGTFNGTNDDSVLVNDTDVDSPHSLTAVLDIGPSNGTLVLNANGTFTYTPSSTFSGTDSFTYHANDGTADSNLTTVTITVTPTAPGSILTVPDSCLDGTALLITGTSGDDSIHVSPGSSGATLKVTINGVTSTVAKPTGRIIVLAGGGNDTVQIASSISNSAWLYGEGGNDKLNAANDGTHGNLLIGGEGNDELSGGGGRDVMIGGQGADKLIGNANDDILVAGFTTKDDRNTAADHEKFWCDVMHEWTSTNSFSDRVDNLRGLATQHGNAHNNGSYLLPNVLDDYSADQIDMLQGSSGEDWFIFLAGEDKVVGKQEAVN